MGFLYELCSTLLHLPPPQIPLLGSNPGLLRLRHWQSDALTTRLDLIHISARSHSRTRLDLIHLPYIHVFNVHGFSLYLQTPFAPPVAKSPSTRFTFLLNSSSVSCAIATCFSCVQVFLSALCIHTDPDPTLHFYAIPDPDPSFTHVGKSEEKKYYFSLEQFSSAAWVP